MQQEIRRFFKLGAKGLFLKSFVWCGQFVIFLALFWTKKTLKKHSFLFGTAIKHRVHARAKMFFMLGGYRWHTGTIKSGKGGIKKYANRLEIRFLLRYTARMCRPSSAGRALHS